MKNIDNHVLTKLGFTEKSNVEDKIWIGKQYIFASTAAFEKNEYNFGVWKVNTEARKNIAGTIFFLRINGDIRFATNIKNAKKRIIQTNYPKISFFKIKNQFNKKFNIDPPAINEKILDQFSDILGCNVYISIEKSAVEFEFNIEKPERIDIEQIINFIRVTMGLN